MSSTGVVGFILQILQLPEDFSLRWKKCHKDQFVYGVSGENYLRKNGFEKVSDYYQKKGINEDTKWDVVFTPDNKKLSFVVEYLD